MSCVAFLDKVDNLEQLSITIKGFLRAENWLYASYFSVVWIGLCFPSIGEMVICELLQRRGLSVPGL